MRNNKIYILGAAATNDRFWVYIKPVGERMPLDGFIDQEYIKLHKNNSAHDVFNQLEPFITLRLSITIGEILQD